MTRRQTFLQSLAGLGQTIRLIFTPRVGANVAVSAGVAAILMSCATPISRSQPEGGPSSDQATRMNNSSVSIEYVLGRDRYKFVARAENAKVTGSTYLDKQLLKKGQIDEQRYPGFFSKASEIVQNLNRAPASDTFCRSPFVLKVRTGTETQEARGCRSSDDGALSKLVKEGEFLLYSKK